MEFTTTAEREEWEGYLRTNPERVIAALGIFDPHAEPNQWGDTHAVRPIVLHRLSVPIRLQAQARTLLPRSPYSMPWRLLYQLVVLVQSGQGWLETAL